MEIFKVDTVTIVIAGCLGMTLLAGFIIFFVFRYQKKALEQQYEIQVLENKFQVDLLSATIKVEEKERERIAKNIHDDLGTYLNVLKINLHQLAKRESILENERKRFAENIQIVDEAMRSVKGIIKDLYPPVLYRLGFIKALNELCNFINQSRTIVVKLNTFNFEERFLPEQEVQFYRISQEIINSIIKHSLATFIEVDIHSSEKKICITFRHDGKGILKEQLEHYLNHEIGIGLKNIISRVKMLNATLDLQKQNEFYITTICVNHDEKN